MKRKSQEQILTVGDPNAKAMWGRCRSQVYRDKTKYTRKRKHKKDFDNGSFYVFIFFLYFYLQQKII